MISYLMRMALSSFQLSIVFERLAARRQYTPPLQPTSEPEAKQ